ncbi:MAG: S-methyl-5'-thioadenosine phosphorylase, partial [Myxococcales bacterium]|nr:S-methyl-5'-thioadenosine phosphorylase [Myxococcales bacterium]
MTAEPALAVIGGSGLYELPGLERVVEREVTTPYGAPSDRLCEGRLAGRRVLFLARHGARHTLLPGEINARANLWALKDAGATRVISVSAVGSLRDAIAPGDAVIVRQLLDLTRGRPGTFFGDGVVAHVSLADPVCDDLAAALGVAAARRLRVHDPAVYACIEGPRFSTRAESRMLRDLGADVVGMTGAPEAALAREAELCYASLALPTDYDCWRAPGDEVRVPDVLAQLRSNVAAALEVLADALAALTPDAP